jgi:hypothetical protein
MARLFMEHSLLYGYVYSTQPVIDKKNGTYSEARYITAQEYIKIRNFFSLLYYVKILASDMHPTAQSKGHPFSAACSSFCINRLHHPQKDNFPNLEGI